MRTLPLLELGVAVVVIAASYIAWRCLSSRRKPKERRKGTSRAMAHGRRAEFVRLRREAQTLHRTLEARERALAEVEEAKKGLESEQRAMAVEVSASSWMADEEARALEEGIARQLKRLKEGLAVEPTRLGGSITRRSEGGQRW